MKTGALGALTLLAATIASAAEPPVARRVPSVSILHGERRTDYYHWLRSRDEATMAYLKAENAYATAMMKPTEALQQKLYEEMHARLDEDEKTAPVKRGAFEYFTVNAPGREHPLFARSAGGKTETLLDLNELAKKEKFVSAGDVLPSDDGKLLGYLLDTTGKPDPTLFVKDLATGKLLPERVPHVSSWAWASDGKTIFYVVMDATTRPYRLYRHVLGSWTAKDPLVYEEKDPQFMLAVTRTRSRAFMVVSSSAAASTELRVIAADKPAEAARVIVARRPGVSLQIDHQGDRFLLLSDDHGPAFRLLAAPLDEQRADKWTELIAHDPQVPLTSISAFADHFVVGRRSGGLPQLVVYAGTGAARNGAVVSLPEKTYSLTDEDNPDYASDKLRFGYSSFVTPPSTIEYDCKTGERRVLRQDKVQGHDPSRYVTERVHAKAADGALIPISLVYKKSLPRDGRAPLWLVGYGAYGMPWDARWSGRMASFADRGVVFAIAHVRGGGELGRPWHDAGRLHDKRNTFTDFITAAEYLVKEKYAAADRIAASGGSAGGLLIGAVANLRPDLFRVLVADAPFVDIIHTMLDPSLPLTTGEFGEWGNPRIEDDYVYMRSYSPYDNVWARDYPAMLVLTSLADSQVLYFEPAKWTARLRHFKTDKNLLLFRCEMEVGGHTGPSGRYERLHQGAFMMAFVLWQLGVSGS